MAYSFSSFVSLLFLLSLPILSAAQCPSTQADTTVNFMTNGDFQIPYLGYMKYRFTSDPLYGWTTAFKIQQGTGAIYNSRWGTATQVIEIDTFQNQMYNQTLNLPACQALLTLSYAARQRSPLATSGLRIWWNNQTVMHVQTSVDYDIHSETFTVQAVQGNNYLALQARGASDGVGMSIDNVKFNRIVNTNRLIINGQCLCEPGYYEESISSSCKSCSSADVNCKECSYTNNFLCTMCLTNTFLNSSFVCQKCNIFACLNCSSLSSCSVCNQSIDYFLNQTDKLCHPCAIQGCIDCLTISSCSICNQSAGYVLNPITSLCEPCLKDYFVNITSHLCQKCSLLNCLNCISLSECSSCNESKNFFLNKTSKMCQQCQNGLFVNTATHQCEICILSYCLTCSSFTTCSICDYNNSYYVDSSGQCLYCDIRLNKFINIRKLSCQSCVVEGCLVCSSSVTCKTCDYTYLLNQRDTCTPICTFSTCAICGNNIVEPNQQCDDGNVKAGDGCSAKCEEEIGYNCQLNKDIRYKNSLCFYEGKVDMMVLYIEKSDNANQIQVLISLYPSTAAFWQNVNFAEMISLSYTEGIDSYAVKQNIDGTVSIVISYSIDIQNKQITVELDPKKSGNPVLSKIASTNRIFSVLPSDNQKAAYYDKKQYDMAKIIQNLSGVINGFSLFLYLISLLAGKLIGIELMSVIQISYTALIVLTEVNPCFKALSKLQLVNGFNYFSNSKQYLVDQKTPYSIRGLKLHSLFFLNYNFTMLLLLVAYSTSLICYLLSKTLFKNNLVYGQKALQVAKRCACEIALNCLLFSGYIIGVSFGIQVVYGTQGINEPLQLLSFVQIIILFSLFVLYFILIAKFSQNFGQFTSFFQKQTGGDQNNSSKTKSKFKQVFEWMGKRWYNILLIQRLIVGSFLVFFINLNLSLLFPILIFASYLALTIYIRPYLLIRHNMRFVANMIITIAILLIYLSYSASESTNKENSQFILPVIVCVLLMICIFYSAVLLAYQIFKDCKARGRVDNNSFDEFPKAEQHRDGVESRNTTINNLATENQCLSEVKRQGSQDREKIKTGKRFKQSQKFEV